MDPRPCLTVEELFAWEPPNDVPRAEDPPDTAADARLPHHPLEVPRIEPMRPSYRHNRHPLLMVIHTNDKKDDFPLCDRWKGCAIAKCPPLLFTHWWHMDTFVYYGRRLITIPPPAYTSIAHRHGVRVLGTIMLEQQIGLDALVKMLASVKHMEKTVAKLVQIMQTWRFDGWLVRLMIQIKDDDPAHLLAHFVKMLKAATIAANPRALIVWYDQEHSDLQPGSDAWHTMIVARNREFYNAAGAIVTFHEDHEDIWRSNDGTATVFLIVDVWGRNGLPGGWHTHDTMARVLKYRIEDQEDQDQVQRCSVALTGPCWAVDADENRGANVAENSFKLWSTMIRLMDTRALTFFPFKSTFRNGISENGQYFRIRDMDLMPHLALSEQQLIPTEHGLRIKTPGRYVLWKVNMLQTSPDLRVKITVDKPVDTVKIDLDWHEMQPTGYRAPGNGANTIELQPKTRECKRLFAIYVVTTEPDTVLSYFEAYIAETAHCMTWNKPSKE